ncbi:MAG: hypothetical protein GAK44_00240 [Pseudomonas delhiensis]|nr:MAG: hypothetical protein GAK44_00240 [Pseudomonas delhiensis]
MQGVFDAGFLLFHLDFGGSTDLDHGNTASQFGQTLLQFFTVVVRAGLFDLLADLGNAGFDVSLGASAVDDGGVFLVDDHALGVAQVLQGGAFQAQANFFGNHGAAGQDGDVLQHGLAAVAEARSLDGCDFDDATHVVHHQGGQGFAFDVFSNDQQRTTGFGDSFQHRQHFADVGDFLVDQQQQRVVQFGNHGVRLVDEVGRQVAAVELHAFYDGQFVFQARAFFDGDHAFFTDLVHGFGNDLADGFVGVGGDGANLGDGFGIGAGLGQFLELGNDGDGRLVDAALQVHRVHAGSDGLQAFVDDGLSQDGSGGGAVTGSVVGLGSNVFHQLGAHVLELVFEFDFLGDGNAVLGDGRSAEGLVQYDVTAFRAQGRLDGIGQHVYADQHFLASGIAELNFFGSHVLFPQNRFR